MTDELKIAMIDLEADALNMSINIDKLEADLDDTYVPRVQDRKSIKVSVDGVEMRIDKDNCNATVLELFEKIVYDRQIEKISQYLKGKYTDGLMSHEEATHELQGIDNPIGYKRVYSADDIAPAIANDVVGQ